MCKACRQIIQVNLTSEDFRPIVPGAEIEFTYSVRWAPSATPFSRRFERYLDYNFFEHQARCPGAFSSDCFLRCAQEDLRIACVPFQARPGQSSGPLRHHARCHWQACMHIRLNLELAKP